MGDEDRLRWDARWAAREAPGPPAGAVRALRPWLPARGRALDLAGGAGRHAVWLAELGLDVTLVDVSPVAVSLAREAASRAGVDLTAWAHDVDAGPPAGPWDLVLVHHFLDRAALGALVDVLAPGGRAVVVHPTRANLARHPRPSARFLLGEGELPGLLRGLTVLHHAEGWTEEGRHEAWCVAERPGA